MAPRQAKNELVLTAHAGYEESKMQMGHRWSVDQGILGCVFRNQKSHLSLNTSEDPLFVPASPEANRTKSEMAAPVRTREAILGVLDIESDQLKEFCEFDLGVLETIANQFAVAITNARLYEESKSFNKLLNQKVREKTEELNDANEKILEQQRQLKKENITLKKMISHQRDEQLRPVGESGALKSLLAMVDKIAPTNATALIQGESGTGKELVARRLHERSARADKPYVTINCGALQETLLESELFGHEKGSFTGAHQQKIGLVETADGGTLFLDEIGELGPGIQAKILRFLQEGEIYRVGGKRALKVDVRIISATNKDLEREVRDGQFREDLFYRINTITLRVPPLRKRKEDIPLLVDSFLKNSKYGGNSSKMISPQAMLLLQEYDWPGNIRELQNVIERIKILAEGDFIQPEDIRYNIQFPVRTNISILDLNMSGISLEDLEKTHILKTLDFCQGNKTKAAMALGITIKTLYNKLHRFSPEKIEN
ncbi:MAG: sigma-54-dependent Fis family transcriptional regulator [Deltaproteobacteria bacterium]|nr:sigma-54-dependent Fis family transcriptional regulator [Deltaproteobacteria bacterium]